MVKKQTVFYTLKMLIISAVLGCSPTQENSFLLSEPSCIEGQSQCKILTSLGEITIAFDQAYLVAEQAFNIYVSTSNDSLIVDSGYMEGEDMFMGKIPLFFQLGTPTDKVPRSEDNSSTARVFSAQGFFGSCSEDKMQWRVFLLLRVGSSSGSALGVAGEAGGGHDAEDRANGQTEVSFLITSYQSAAKVSEQK